MHDNWLFLCNFVENMGELAKRAEVYFRVQKYLRS